MPINDSASLATDAIIKAAPLRTRKAVWGDAVRRLLELGKSLPSSAIDALDDALPEFNSEVADGIMGGYLNRVPSRAEIPVSPTTSASGSGAEQLPRWSSDHAPQGGLTELYNRFNALMAEFADLKKCQLEVMDSVYNLAKATKAAFPDSESEDGDDEDDEEIEKSDKIGKALAGQGLAHGTIKQVLSVLASSRHGSSPPDFAQHVLKKANTNAVDLEELTQEQYMRYASAKNALQLAASGEKIHHDILRQAALTVENPSGSV